MTVSSRVTLCVSFRVKDSMCPPAHATLGYIYLDEISRPLPKYQVTKLHSALVRLSSSCRPTPIRSVTNASGPSASSDLYKVSHGPCRHKKWLNTYLFSSIPSTDWQAQFNYNEWLPSANIASFIP